MYFLTVECDSRIASASTFGESQTLRSVHARLLVPCIFITKQASTNYLELRMDGLSNAVESDLVGESLDAASAILSSSIELVDERMGDGTAAGNPQLLGMFMLTAGLCFVGQIVGRYAGCGLCSVTDAISLPNSISDAVASLRKATKGVSEAIENR